jgi:hypothetical protein
MLQKIDNVFHLLKKNLLADERQVFIIAGGPSLGGFDFSKLRNKTCIAINKAIFVLPRAHILWWSDTRFYKMFQEEIDNHSALYKVTGLTKTQSLQYPDDVYKYRFTGHGGYDEREECLKDGNNSGYASLHLAMKLGARKIILLGYDFKKDGEQTHWHEGHTDERGKSIAVGPRTYEDKMLPYFISLQQKAIEVGTEIINASPNSKLELWPKKELEDVLGI